MLLYTFSLVVSYSRPSGTDKEFFIPLFVVPDENFPMPDTHWLLHKMFKEDKITFKEVILLYSSATYLVIHMHLLLTGSTMATM